MTELFQALGFVFFVILCFILVGFLIDQFLKACAKRMETNLENELSLAKEEIWRLQQRINSKENKNA